MGVMDYENLSNKKFRDSNGAIKNALTKMKENTYFCQYLSKNLYDTDVYGMVLNRPCFKFTKLREDIYFIDTSVSGINADKSISTTNFMFVINEKGFWKRFKIFLKEDPTKQYIDTDNGVAVTVNKILNNQLDVDRIELTIINDEYKEILTKLRQVEPNPAIKNHAICKFNNINYYNKRVVIEILNKKEYEVVKKNAVNNQDVSHVSVNLGPYKRNDYDSSTDSRCLIYNPEDNAYAIYKHMYT